jgi:hypothetical protein
MGQLRNGDGVVINEVTVSHRAMSNSPHDALTFDPRDGIRGVNIGGKLWAKTDDTVIRSVNVSFDGVSIECGVDMLMVMSDVEARNALVAKVKAEAKAQEEAEARPHQMESRPEKDLENPGYRAWRCTACEQWCSVKLDVDGAVEFAKARDAGEPLLGCAGASPAVMDAIVSAANAVSTGGMPSEVERAVVNTVVDKKNAAKRTKAKRK